MPVAEFADEPAVADAADDVVRRDGLRQALLTLPLRQRAPVLLRYLEGLSEREPAHRRPAAPPGFTRVADANTGPGHGG
ncbi:hypothetical protein OHS58_17120 [Amycolatopsis sp. NBC_00348]|uniref:sigma factor-like helix-turn-helix DNA-binding protein n=1 Tax=Amycolatopsis sp. NBC_00348 TaxID=2975956 RepID=UPI002E26A9B2